MGESDYPSAKVPLMPNNPENGIDYYYYTDNMECFELANQVPRLNAILVPYDGPVDTSANNMKAKHYKVLPHTLKELQDYEYTFYIDSKHSLDGELLLPWSVAITEEDLVAILEKPPAFGLFPHPCEFDRHSIFDELKEAYFQARCRQEIRLHFEYLKTKNQDDLDCERFFQCTYIWREMKNPIVKEICEFWMSEIEKCGVRDQVSFHFVDKKYKEHLSVLDRQCSHTHSSSPGPSFPEFESRENNDTLVSDASQKYWVVDNFYKDPDSIRQKALGSNFVTSKDFYKGHRSSEPYRPESIKEKFEKLLGKKIVTWEQAPNGVFQYTTPEDPLVYHIDTQTYAAVIYLNPEAPYHCGTTLLTSDLEDPFKWGFLDKTKFNVVDTIGNVYNRLLLFKANNIHAGSEYFGSTPEDSRLVHLFFFNTE